MICLFALKSPTFVSAGGPVPVVSWLVADPTRDRFGQAAPRQSGIVVDFIAPPPIDRGLVPSLERSPDSPETQMRAAIRASSVALDRAGASGAHYIAGKVIVQIVRRQDQADGQALAVGVDETAHVQANVFAAQGAIA